MKVHDVNLKKKRTKALETMEFSPFPLDPGAPNATHTSHEKLVDVLASCHAGRY